jgi:hypothetical protein
LKQHILIAIFALSLGLAHQSHAQATATASRSGGTMQLGGGFSIASPDYGGAKIKGLSVYGDFDVTRHIGIEGDIHYVSMITPTDIGENSFLLGPRYVVRYHRISGYGKALLGLGRFEYQAGTYGHGATFTYGMYSLGGGVDVKIKPHINVRPFDIEFQKWPNYPKNGLSPMVITFGVAYAFR